jgi:predicted small lipoprotein YifL
VTRNQWRLWAAAVLLALSACGGSAPVEMPQRPALPVADFRTQAGHFAELQEAGLAADYLSFARFLGARDAQAVVAQLTEAFGGGSFDVYTAGADTDDFAHRRLVELRAPGARRYLFVALNRAPGGWDIAEWELGRDRAAIAARL